MSLEIIIRYEMGQTQWQNIIHTLYLDEGPRMGKTIGTGSRLELRGVGDRPSI